MLIANEGFALTLAVGSVRAATPLLYCALGEVVYEKSGVLNLGLEGMMLVGAFTAVAVQTAYSSTLLAIVLAMLVTAAAGLAHGAMCVLCRTNQIVTGFAFVILLGGLTSYLGRSIVGRRVETHLSIGSVIDFSGVGKIGRVIAEQDILSIVVLLAALMFWVALQKTRWGVRLRACGESAESARLLGVPVARMRLTAAGICGAMCGLGGAQFALSYASQWQENMTAGRGWLAVVLVICGAWRVPGITIGAYVFGALTVLQLNLQIAGIPVSQYLLAMLPFAGAIAAMALVAIIGRRRFEAMPANLAVPLNWRIE